MAVIYDDIESFTRYKENFKRFKNVTVFKTKYSIKIDYGKKKVMLNKGGDNNQTNVLGLINRVKRDAENYIQNVSVETLEANDVFWSYYNHSSECGMEDFPVAKIDLTAAYWTKAINLGVLSKDTLDYFETMNFKNEKDKKSGRLKALGSLATVKSVEKYVYGKRDTEYTELIMNENFRSLYMGICNEVANDMREVLNGVDGIFYYWDCIWVRPSYEEEVMNLFKALGYKCTVEKHDAYVLKQKYISYLCCPNKDGELINYPIKN